MVAYTLPDELVLAVFAALASDRAAPALLACATVCRAWRAELSPAVFARITLHSYTSSTPAEKCPASLAAIARFVRAVAVRPPYAPAQAALLAHLPHLESLDVADVTFDTFDDLQALSAYAGTALSVARCTCRSAPAWNTNWHGPRWANTGVRGGPALAALRLETRADERVPAPLHYLVYGTPSVRSLRKLEVAASRDYVHHLVLLAQDPACALEELDLTVLGLDVPLEGEGNFYLNGPRLTKLALRTRTAPGNAFVLTAFETCQLPNVARLALDLVLPSANELAQFGALLYARGGMLADPRWAAGCFPRLQALDVTLAGVGAADAAQTEYASRLRTFFEQRCKLVEPAPHMQFTST